MTWSNLRFNVSRSFVIHGNKSTILLFYSIFRTTPEVSSKLYFVEICKSIREVMAFNHKRTNFWLPNFGFKRSLLSLLNTVYRSLSCGQSYKKTYEA